MDQLFNTELDPMTHDEKAFFKAMGARVAESRKASSITQAQLAEDLYGRVRLRPIAWRKMITEVQPGTVRIRNTRTDHAPPA